MHNTRTVRTSILGPLCRQPIFPGHRVPPPGMTKKRLPVMGGGGGGGSCGVDSSVE